MATPVQIFWFMLTRLGWKDRAFEILAPYGVTSISYLNAQKLEELNDKLASEWKERSKRPRGAVIHFLCIMPNYNYQTLSGAPDYDKIDDFVKSKMKGKALNQLTLPELSRMVTIVKMWYRNELKTKA